MSSWGDFVGRMIDAGVEGSLRGGRRVVARFGRVEDDYHALEGGPALVDRSCRGLLEVSGRDRLSWLHNLTTNQVKTLGREEGTYAFALNVQGRILFDVNVLVRGDTVWLDIDRLFLPSARKHFDKYIIMEDVRIADRSDEWVRVAVAGARAGPLLAEMGLPQAASMPSLGGAPGTWRGTELWVIRHDFCGVFAVEVFVAADQSETFWRDLTDVARSLRATPVGDDAVQVRRIEAGLPWPGREITEEYLPAETRQIERAVSFQKGCYLGQEVVERMRSRNVVARSLCGLLVDGDAVPAEGAEIRVADDRPIGLVTSACHSIALGRAIAMGYVKSAHAGPGGEVRIGSGEGMVRASITPLPFVGSKGH